MLADQMSTSLTFRFLVVIFLMPDTTTGYPQLQDAIPNGHQVPNPCDSSTFWNGVGHKNTNGGGDVNQFGEDFEDSGFKWSSDLCKKDSDGDGMTNGEELGDPNCTWTGGNTTLRLTNITHPGVCEPISSAKCSSQNQWLNCDNVFNCSDIYKPNVRSEVLLFPGYQIPAKQTTYACFVYKLPNNTVSDVIAFTPVIDNPGIVHHMLLFACEDSSNVSLVSAPYQCEMATRAGCNSIIALWSIGLNGACYSDQFGFRIGPGGYQYAILQIHYNNYNLQPNLDDASGVTLYYTPNLRPNRGDVLLVTQQYLNIPPKQSSVKASAQCSPDCTNRLPASIFVAETTLHMHLLGASGGIYLYRNQQLVKTFENDSHYDYNTPTFQKQTPVTEVKPGDQISVECVFNSTSRTTTTNFGPATTDEMCIGFLIYYPAPAKTTFRNCGQWRSIGFCESTLIPTTACNRAQFARLVAAMTYLCDANCSKICLELILSSRDTGCIQGDYLEAFKMNTPALASLVIRCNATITPVSNTNNVSSSAEEHLSVFSLILFAYISLKTYSLMRF